MVGLGDLIRKINEVAAKSCLAGIKFLKNDFIKTNDGISGKNTGCTILHNKSWKDREETIYLG